MVPQIYFTSFSCTRHWIKHINQLYCLYWKQLLLRTSRNCWQLLVITMKRFVGLQSIKLIIEARRHEWSNRWDTITVFYRNNIILNSATKSYFEMIDWTQWTVTSPPLLSNVFNEQLIYDKPIIFTASCMVPWTSCRKSNQIYNCSQFKSLRPQSVTWHDISKQSVATGIA